VRAGRVKSGKVPVVTFQIIPNPTTKENFSREITKETTVQTSPTEGKILTDPEETSTIKTVQSVLTAKTPEILTTNRASKKEMIAEALIAPVTQMIAGASKKPSETMNPLKTLNLSTNLEGTKIPGGTENSIAMMIRAGIGIGITTVQTVQTKEGLINRKKENGTTVQKAVFKKEMTEKTGLIATIDSNEKIVEIQNEATAGILEKMTASRKTTVSTDRKGAKEISTEKTATTSHVEILTGTSGAIASTDQIETKGVLTGIEETTAAIEILKGRIEGIVLIPETTGMIAGLSIGLKATA
jgi:hypothetical protein